MPTIITLQAIAIVLLLLKIFLQGIRINDLEASDDWEDTDKHPWTNGDCCRCAEFTERFNKEIMK